MENIVVKKVENEISIPILRTYKKTQKPTYTYEKALYEFYVRGYLFYIIQYIDEDNKTTYTITELLTGMRVGDEKFFKNLTLFEAKMWVKEAFLLVKDKWGTLPTYHLGHQIQKRRYHNHLIQGLQTPLI